MCVIVCQGPHACTVPNPGRRPHHFPALLVWMDITLPSIKPSPSHTLPVIVLSLFPALHLSLSLSPFVIIRWQKRCCLSASHWLLDIESGKGRGVPSRPYNPSFFCLAARLWCCRQWWLCIRVSTCAVSFPVHHCAGEADDWIQSAG